MKKLFWGIIAVFSFYLSFAQTVVYQDASVFPLCGKAVEETSARYQRFPSSLKETARPALWRLSENSAGLYVRFRSDAPSIHARWTTRAHRMPHMTDAGKSRERKLVGNMEPQMREYMLYLPLYDCLDSLFIGTPEGYALEQPVLDSPRRSRPVVMYGTSILQGGCASRAGMAHTAILSRWLDREVINLGFSGNAHLDTEVAQLIASVEDPSVIVLDYVPNCTAKLIEDKGLGFFRIVRDAHPDVPVVFVENPEYTHSVLDLKIAGEIKAKNDAQRALYESLRKAGEKKLYYVKGKGMTGDDGEAAVDGVHFTDLGMMRYACHLYPVLKKLIGK